MPVNSTHPDFDKVADLWRQCRDVIGGAVAIKQSPGRYLPKPEGRTDTEYARYADRAQFFDATAKTVDGMVGGIFRKPPSVELPTALDYLRDDADGRGTDIALLAKALTTELISVGRAGLLVDMPSVPEGLRLDQERAINARPRILTYSAENIINWRTEVMNGQNRLTLVVLKEEDRVPSLSDPFVTEPKVRYRVLELRDNVYTVALYEEGDGDWTPVEFSTPRMSGGKAFDTIPFFFVGAVDNGPQIDKPPMYDISSINIGHYRNSADFEDALYMVGQPTPWITGLDQAFIDKNKGSLRIGSRAAWLLPEGAAAGMLEISGDLAALKGAMEAKESQMVQLGARLVSQNPSGVEAAETIRLRASGEASILDSVARNVSKALTRCLMAIGAWLSVSEEATFEANSDFFATRLSPQELAELVRTWQTGAITYRTLFENLRTGEVIADADVDPEEYSEELAAEKPVVPMSVSDEDIEDDEDDEADEPEDEDEND